MGSSSLSFPSSRELSQAPQPQHSAAARLHIFKAGEHTSGNGITRSYSAQDLADCARAYDPAIFAAPLVLGHPENNAPAYGWVQRLEAQGEDLYAYAESVDPLLVQSVRAGLYRKVSASLYLPGAAGNPAPGALYLRHVGMLGAAAPAVKGLQTVDLAESALDFDAACWADFDAAPGRACRTQCAQAPHHPPTQGAADMANNTPAAPTEGAGAAPAPEQGAQPSAAEQIKAFEKRLAALEEENKRLKADAQAAREQLAAAAQAAQHAEHAAFTETLVKQGRLLPSAQAVMVATLDHLASAPVIFAEGVPLVQGFKAALLQAPPAVPLGEAAPAEHSEEQAPIKPLAQMTGYEAAALFKADRAAFNRAAGIK